MKFAIETHQLTKRFGSTVALNNIDLQIPQGSIFGLVGPNGAGKTTTFNILCGFLHPLSGEAKVLGVPLRNRRKILGQIGVIPQDSKPYIYRTAMDLLIYFGNLKGIYGSVAKSSAIDILKKVQLADKAYDKIYTFSHGMRKRFDIAQAFLGQPEVIFLDEPTSGLDPENAHHIRELVKSFRKKSTIIYSSHNLNEVQNICDEVAIIKSGQIVRCGSISELTGLSQHFAVQIIGTNISIDPILSIKGVEEAHFFPNEQKIEVTYNSNIIPTESIISKTLEHILKNGNLVKDLQKGKTLEETYLKSGKD